MEYTESLKLLRRLRHDTIKDVSDAIRRDAKAFAQIGQALTEMVYEFHEAQRTYRISEWWQLDMVLPKDYSTMVSTYGPYLSFCTRSNGRIKKTRVSDSERFREVVGSDLAVTISEYKRLGNRLSAITELLNLHCTLDRASLSKGQVQDAFRKESLCRIEEACTTMQGLSDSLDKIDADCDEAIFEFNAIEGKRKRYGSFLARWETPSRMPSKTFAGPTGPSVFYIAFTRGKRLSAPIRNLYLKVHQRSPRGEVPLTKQMVQKSRLGKHMQAYRDAYKQILILRHERNQLIDVIKAVQKRLA